MPSFRVAAVVAALAALPLATGCAKRITEVDASYTRIEGTETAAAMLTVWADTPVPLQRWSDAGNPPGPSAGDILLGTEPLYLSGAGQVLMMLIDRSPANGFQMMRRAGNGGFEPLRDFVIEPTRKWVDTQWETYRVTDPLPSGFSPATYVGRGLVGGTVTSGSPLSNHAELRLASVPPAVEYTANPETNGDSLFTMTWNPVAGAAGYWVHVYQFRSDARNADRYQAATPRPIFDGPVQDHFIAYVAAPSTSVRMGGSTGATVLAYRPALVGREYEVRITAVSATGELVGYLPGSTRTILIDDENYVQFPSGAITVNTSRRF